MSSYWCVVPAAGRGRRAGGDRPKQYQPLAGTPMLLRTLERLASHPRIAGLMVVLDRHDGHWPGLTTLADTPLLTVVGGGERSDSVLAGLRGLPDTVTGADFVLVHDAARPCVRHADIDRLLDLAVPAGGGLLGAPLRDTLKRADAHGRSIATEPREARWRAFTPQLFRRGELLAAIEHAHADGLTPGDEARAMEHAGFAPLLVEGAEDNLKVTTAADFALAEFLLARSGG